MKRFRDKMLGAVLTGLVSLSVAGIYAAIDIYAEQQTLLLRVTKLEEQLFLTAAGATADVVALRARMDEARNRTVAFLREYESKEASDEAVNDIVADLETRLRALELMVASEHGGH